MDIGNISNMYSDVLSANNQSTTKMENKLNTDLTQATDDELMDACKQFEAYFVEQMFKSMMKTVPKNEEMSASTSTLTDYYKDEMMRELATESTETNSLGLAQTLYEQMKRNYEL
ncbi:MAG: rod-binding protein [Lachnospiraceae bacterium]|nr:rod-binding protein [Lachnospiraceae bacterium]